MRLTGPHHVIEGALVQQVTGVQLDAIVNINQAVEAFRG